MDHFQNPRNVGKMDDADGVGEVGNAVCGDIMKIYLKVKDGIITDVKFNTFGCGSAIATSSMATEMIKGKRIEDALELSNKAVVEALSAFLRTALDKVLQQYSLAAVKRAHALWPMEFVGGKRKHIDVHFLNVYFQMTRRLNRVRVEKNALFLADCPDFGYRLYRAYLVVGKHYRNEAGILPDGVCHFLRRYYAAFVNVEQSYLKALFFKLVKCVEHRVVLKRR